MKCAACGFDAPAGSRFCGQCGARLDDAALARGAPSAAAAATRSAAAPTAERRLITVLFCDLAGSTELAERLDVEELREFVRAYQGACAEVIERYGGHVAQYLGDGLLVYFGYPMAHEDDARRAVLAGLEITARVPSLAARLPARVHVTPAVRIGIHTGLTVTGEVGAGATREQLALGEAPNIAARLQSLAGYGEVVLSSATARLVEGAAELEPRGPQELRGVSRPIDVFRAVRTRPGAGDAVPRRAFRRAPLIGRETELARVLALFDRTISSGQRLLLIEGEPGVGKSRLAQSVREALADEATWLAGACSPLHTHASLYPIAAVLRQLAGIESTDDAFRRLQRLEAALESVGLPIDPNADFLAAVIGVETGGRYHPLGLPPQLRRERTLEAVLALLRAHATARPLLLALEDVHWADATTVELLGMMATSTSPAALFGLLTTRPGFAPPWIDAPLLEMLRLAPLDTVQSASLVASIAGGATLPPSLVRAMIERADGVPLFLEELVAAVLETEASERADAAEIPVTLQGTLMARLDRLGDAKTVAQYAAVLGRRFGEPLLRDVLDGQALRLAKTLRELVADGVLVAHAGADTRYEFRHALLQEAAYESLLRSTRRRTHARVADALERSYPQEAEQEPATLGHHWSLAGQPARAAPCFARAAERASAAYANEEAVAYFRRAITEAGEARAAPGEGAVDWSARLAALHEQLGDVLALQRMQEDAEAAFLAAVTELDAADAPARARLYRKIGTVHQQERERALGWFARAGETLADEQPDRPPEWWREWVSLLLGRMWTCYWYDEPDEMLALATRVQPHIDAHATTLQRVEFFDLLTLTSFRQDRYSMGEASLSHAAAYADAAEATGILTEIASARFTYGFALLFHGSLDAAEREFNSALAAAQRSGNRTIEIRVLTYLGTLYRRMNRPAEAFSYAARSLEAASSSHMLEYIGMAHANLAWHALQAGDADGTIRHAADAVEAWRACAMTYPFQWTALLPYMAALLDVGNAGAAFDCARTMLDPAQHALPPDVAEPLRDALRLHDHGQHEEALGAAARALAAARAAGLLHAADGALDSGGVSGK